MKNRFLVTMALILLGSACMMAQFVTIDNITYCLYRTSGFARVEYADKDIEVANILSSVEYKGTSYPVTEIYSLKNRMGISSNILREVSIPNTVKKIHHNAFSKSKLQEIVIPNSVKSIGEYAFKDTPIRKITISDSPIKMGKNPFGNCKFIAEVKSPDGNSPLWITPYLPEDCPFILALRYSQQSTIDNVYGQNNQSINFQQPTNNRQLTAEQQPVAVQEQPQAPSSDVDVDIPQVPDANKSTFAIIFANENYQDETNVDYAKNDGEIFKNYCLKTLGLPEKNVHFVANATLNNFIGELDWLKQVCDAFGGEANVIFYYAGHGIPDEASGSAYLLPTDGNSRILRTCFSINELYETLGKMPAKQVTVLMDACFSGAKRDGNMLASARGVAIKAKAGAPKGNMIVLSAAQGDETAYKYEDAKHGLFTYFLLKKLKETKGNVTMGELSQYIQDQVKRYSIVENGKSQTPSTMASQVLGDSWKGMRLRY